MIVVAAVELAAARPPACGRTRRPTSPACCRAARAASGRSETPRSVRPNRRPARDAAFPGRRDCPTADRRRSRPARTRTPRSSSRRVISSCRPCSPSPYSSRIALRLAAGCRRRRSLRPACGRPARTTGCALRAARRRAACCEMPAVELLHQVELAALLGGRRRAVADVLDQLVDLGVLGVDVRALIGARQKRDSPVLRGHDRIAAGAHGDEAGQVLILRAQAVGDPGAKAGPRQPAVAAVHQHQRRLVVGHVGVHRADDAQVVDVLRPSWQTAR